MPMICLEATGGYVACHGVGFFALIFLAGLMLGATVTALIMAALQASRSDATELDDATP